MVRGREDGCGAEGARCSRAGLSSLQVILMSATINCKEFADYFAVPVQNKMNPAYVFEVEGKPHTIEEYYLNDLGHIYHSGVCRMYFFFYSEWILVSD